MAEDDHGDIDGAEHRQFVGLFEQTAFSFEERPVCARLVADGLKRAVLSWWERSNMMRIPTRRRGAGYAYTERFRSSLIALISILRLPIVRDGHIHVRAQAETNVRSRRGAKEAIAEGRTDRVEGGG